MSLTHAILGILSHQPMTGYELKTQNFDESIAHFWPADQAQIYRTLDKMAEQGWVEGQLEIQADRPNRKVYSITEAGRRELVRWLAAPQPLTSYREPFMIQLFFAGDLSNQQIIDLLEAWGLAHRQRLNAYQQIDLPPLNHPQADRDTILQRLTLELGIRVEQAYLDWVETALETVRHLQEA